MQIIQRQTAFKLWINNIINSKTIREEGEFESTYIEFNNIRIARINIIATVISTFKTEDNRYASLIVDDNSGQIQIKTWSEDTKLLNNLNIGEIVNIIGRIKHYNNETYIIPEIIKTVNPNWELIRKFELIKTYGLPKEKNTQIQETTEELIYDDVNLTQTRQDILALIDKLDFKDGVNLNDVLSYCKNKEESKAIITELIKDGEIFENKPGKLKLIS